jgi:hypothetical protein
MNDISWWRAAVCLLIEEENDGGVPEPLVVADGVEQL